MQPGTKKLFSVLWAFLLAWLTLQYLFPLFFPFLLGLILALAAEPMVGFLSSHLHIPRPVSSGISVTMVFVLLALLLLILCAFLVRQLRAITGILPDLTLTMQNGTDLLRIWLLRVSSAAPGGIRGILQDNVNTLFTGSTSLFEQAIGWLLGLAKNLLSHIPNSTLTLGTAVLSGFMISAKLPKLRHWMFRRFSRERLRALLAAGKRMRHAAGGWLLAQAKLMCVTFGILYLGFLLLRIPRALMWALVTAAVDAFPVLGTGTVLLPWSLISLLQGNTPRAIGLLGCYATVALIRSTLEPRLVGAHLGLDPLVTLMALYIGFQLWGIGGMLLAPLLTVTAVQILPDRKRDSSL